MKKCKACGVKKSLYCFSYDSKRQDKKKPVCIKCMNEAEKDYKPEKPADFFVMGFTANKLGKGPVPPKHLTAKQAIIWGSGYIRGHSNRKLSKAEIDRKWASTGL